MSVTTVVFDLDSTLADTSPRHHLIDQEDKEATDWVAYSLAAGGDTPFMGPCVLLKLLYNRGVHIVILTARSESARFVTVEWLTRLEIPYDELILRDDLNEQQPMDFKLEELKYWQNRHTDHRIVLVVEDFPENKRAFEEAGYTVLLVNPDYPQPEDQAIEAEAAEVGA